MSTPAKRIAFHTLGCKLNFSESSTIKRDFIKRGYETVHYKDSADYYVLNTCSVTENADKEARKLIRQAKRTNPYSTVAVIGCYAQLKPNEIAAIDGVDLVLGANEKFNVLNHLENHQSESNNKVIHSKINDKKKFIPSFSLDERTRSYLKIQDGCDYTCSFCTIPLARGKSRSATIEKTLKIAENISRSDSREIVLTGINIGDFGKHSNETLFDLIQQLDLLKDIDRFRISSIEPNLLTNDIIEFSSNSKKFMPHFHIPLQSGSDKILSNMRRRYRTDLFKDRIAIIKNKIPHACIGVDVIVGFPGETDKDFIATYNFINSLDISYLHVFTYSERPNTDAIDIDQIVSKKTRIKRSKMLHILSDKKNRYFHNQFIDQTRPVLFESIKNNHLVGHTDNYIEVRSNIEPESINKIREVKLSKNCGKYVEGKIL
jgi:threonylcarbamoyladenosine tRNA methylthiotransferase MtaB